ncbi:hypothetical protein TNCV_4030771 [Trichonephila clavipes]|nr:hypothetical protein TNCV_4030771 [Trichonephila clavipes]
MPPNTLRLHTESVLIKSVGLKVLWTVVAETTSAGGLENISLPFSSMPKLWRWRSVVSPSVVKKSDLPHRLWQHSFFPIGNIPELNRTVTCMVLKVKANDRRTSSQMNFVVLYLTTSD